MANRFSVDAVFRAVDRVTAPVSKIQNRIGKMTRGIGTGLTRATRGLDSFNRGLKRTALGLTAVLAIGGAAGADIIRTGAAFEQSLVTAAVKFPGEIRQGTKAFEELSDAAKEVGRTTEFTASQSAEALNFLAMAGFDAKTSIGALPGVVDLATVAALDLGRATDIATDSMGAFNLLSDDAATNTKNLARVSDLLAATSTSANTTIEDMFEALKQGAPVATAAGQDIETTAALIASMANAGIKGTKAGTGLKNIFLSLANPGSRAARIMKELEVAVDDGAGGMRDAVDVFADFRAGVSELPGLQQLQVFNEIFGKIPIAAAINLSNAADKTREFKEELQGATGTTKEMASVMRDTVQGSINNLKSAIEAVKISIFEMEKGPLRDAIDRMTEWTRANEDLIATKVGEFLLMLIDNFDAIVKGLVAIGKAVIFITTLTIALKALSAVIAFINLLMTANPIGLIIVGIGLLIVGLALLIRKHLEPIKAFFAELMAGFEELTDMARDFANNPIIKALTFGLSSKVVDSREEDDRRDRRKRSAEDPQVVSQGERFAAAGAQIFSTTNKAEVTLRAGEGTSAEVTEGNLSGGLKLIPSGGF